MLVGVGDQFFYELSRYAHEPFNYTNIAESQTPSIRSESKSLTMSRTNKFVFTHCSVGVH